MKLETIFISHESCEQCGSSDAKAIYDDGHGFCFSCETYYPKDEARVSTNGHGRVDGDTEDAPKAEGFLRGDFKELRNRRITEETCRKWNYEVGFHQGSTCHIASFKNESGKTVAQKIRLPGKNFMALGDFSKAGFYGSHLWGGGKKLVITEGELDALSVSQIQEYKWPVVSLPNGAAGGKRVVASNLDYLNRFEEIIFMFDNDEAGQKAAKACASTLPVGKAKIASLPLKDANEMLAAGREAEVIQSIWNAKTFRPDGIIDGTDLWETVSKELVCSSVPYPWQSLNESTHGIRWGEIVTLCAGSGVGKSQICKEITLDLINNDNHVGYIALEENVRRTSLSIMGMYLNKQLHLRPDLADQAEKRKAFDATVGSGRLFMYDHFGSLDTENLLNRIRYMVTGCDCKYIFLDHLSIVVSGMESGDERRFIDNTMTMLRSLVEELNFALILVSHLKRPDGRGHEEGGFTSLSQLRGSAGIAQLSDLVIGLERNQQDEESPDPMTVRVLKNRWSGETGRACYLDYSRETGRLTESVMEDEEV